MGLRAAAMRGGAWLSGGQGLAQALVFIRNLLIARFIGTEDFGIAAAFAITQSVIEALSNLNVEKAIVQDAEGESTRLQSTAHTINAVRGVILGGLFLALGGPAARLLGAPEAAWAFRTLAFIPLLRGLGHLDLPRMQREMRFAPTIVAEVGSQVAATAVGCLILIWVRDYTVMLAVLFSREGVRLALTHLLAERPFGLGWDREFGMRIIRFGLPLLANGLVMVGILEGDRMIVGSFYGPAALGIFAVAFGVPRTLSKVAVKTHASLLLPMLARVQDQPAAYRQRYELALQWLAVLAALLAVVLIFAGPRLVVLAYGEDYRAAGELVGLLGLMQAIRLLRRAPVLAALARGDSMAVTYSNFGRALWLIGAVSVAWLGWPLVWVAGAGVLGEATALGIALGLGRWRHQLPLRVAGLPLVVFMGASGGALAVNDPSRTDWLVLSLGQLLLIGLTVGGGLLILSRLRHEMTDILRAFIRRQPL